MPLLTHEEWASRAPAAVAVARRPPTQGGGGRPPNGKATRRRSPWKRVRTWLFVLLGVLVMVPLVAFVIGWLVIPVPQVTDAALTQTATFTFADGPPVEVFRPKDASGANINRSIVTLDKVPQDVRQAVLAAEDRTFYTNPGFDFLGIARAVFKGVGGGSTITQQYVKVSTGQNQNSLLRKFKEVILSIKISKDQSKDQILENYLNTVYFGRGAYGIQTAAQAYFGKDVGQLSLSQAAMLAGMIQSPSYLDPTTNLAGNTIRWNYTLGQMVEAGFITSSTRATQKFPVVTATAPAAVGTFADDRHHIYEAALKELHANGISDDTINTEGLTVTTTVDSRLQRYAVDTIDKVMQGQPAHLREALVSVDPRTGAIVAYYGGRDLGTDYAGQGYRPPGSSFKPFVLAAALGNGTGIGLGSTYDGTDKQIIKGQPVSNSDGDSCSQQCTIMTAMTHSTNTVFYNLAVDIGPVNVINAARQAGIPATDLTGTPDGGISLGDQDVHPVDMASAYATFAADGVKHAPYIVAKVTTADGRILLDRSTNPVAGTQAFPQQLARNVTESLLDVAAGSSFPLSGGRPAAAKTGTVQLNDTGENKDAWTVGYTPSLSTAVWVGSDKSDPLRTKAGKLVYGRTFGGPIWQQFTDAALKGTPNEPFSDYQPMGVPAYANGDSGGSLVGTDTGGAAAPATGQNGADPNATDTNGGDTTDPNGNGNGNGDGNGGGAATGQSGGGNGGNSDKKKKKKKSHDNAGSLLTFDTIR